jgi:gamma-glutamyl-gamma-aminobutyrate hydrolase PuuD
MKRVAVTYRVEAKIRPYLDALHDAGADAVGVTPEQTLDSLGGLNGLLLAGGTDLAPDLYGQEPHPQAGPPDRERDALEIRLLGEALRRDLPVLAICRGMQLFNVCHPGGTLIQHLEGHSVRGDDSSRPVHPVAIQPGTRLAQILGEAALEVNSRHHQAVDRVGGGLVVSAQSSGDRVVEALERPDRRFALAVQWHPEDQYRRFPIHARLFQAFADAL